MFFFPLDNIGGNLFVVVVFGKTQVCAYKNIKNRYHDKSEKYNYNFLCSCLSDLINSEETNLTQVKHTAAASTTSIHRLYFTISKSYHYQQSVCISGYQPTETKMALVINTINTIGNTKSHQGMKAIQQTWNWPCIGPKQEESPFIKRKFSVKTFSVHSDQASAVWMWNNINLTMEEKTGIRDESLFSSF